MGFRVDWRGAAVKAEVKAQARAGVHEALEYVLEQSRREVPIEEATLERSGATDVDPIEPRGTVSYDTPYAVVQHEKLELRHDQGRKAKYLEDPVNRSESAVARILANRIRRAM